VGVALVACWRLALHTQIVSDMIHPLAERG